ncbi:hypothetical protein SLEP1_g22995 [Rubroshorea leprosula]|uniref:Receptor-like serine/threonine-protein kinase n=1 Tax=Rubroshorea leprosula TaxID=152421 RepID=A0AAV5JK63_9ROSI|nr:hypothetical protein SLEP1_g22995 [Rubroshorea leprosula]
MLKIRLMAKVEGFLLLFTSCLFLGSPYCCKAQLRFELMQGGQLRDWEHILSPTGIFKLGFFSPNSSTYRYLGIWYSKLPHNPDAVWVANPENPILDASGVLSLDSDGKLKITHNGGQPIVLNSNQANSSNLTASVMDTGNFVLREAGSTATGGEILWQSFDYPGNTLLPGMKLGMNLKTGKNWVLHSWLSNQVPAPGAFKLGIGNENDDQLVLWQREEVYWTSGVWKSGSFQMAPELTRRSDLYQFSFVSNSDEQNFSYSVKSSSTLSRWQLNTWGQILQYTLDPDGTTWQLTFAGPCKTDANYPSASCILPKPSKCRNESELFVPTRGYYNDSNLLYSDDNTSLALSDCHSSCWKNCSCIAYGSLLADGTGCRLWSKGSNFVQNENFDLLYVLTLASGEEKTRTRSPERSVKYLWWIWCIIAIGLGLSMLLLGYFYVTRRKQKLMQGIEGTEGDTTAQARSLGKSKNQFPLFYHLRRTKKASNPFQSFSFSEIVDATNNFSPANKLGQGGFGPVYKGMLLDGQPIAVKRLARNSGQGVEEFMNEITLIAELQHLNLVRLLGCCIQQEEKMLIYEYMSNKSLDSFLFDPSKRKLLDWKKRVGIIEGVAQGLLYLHKYSRVRVIHRDLKASNILLDHEMNPKISDFGMARIFGHNESRANTNRVVGTYGYMSPEYAMNGIFSVKSDVFSFGVLLLEIVSGKKNTVFTSSDNPLSLIDHAWELWKRGDALKFKDELLESCPQNELLKCLQVGLLCVQDQAADRPTMSDVISMLTNDAISIPQPEEPAYCTRKDETRSTFPSDNSEIHSVNRVSITIVEAR